MYQGPVADVDVHHSVPTQRALYPYLSPGWRAYVERPGRAGPISVEAGGYFPNPHGYFREETYPPGGGHPGSDRELLRSQLLDRHRVEVAVLTYNHELFFGAFPNPYFAAELVRAANDWTVAEWLSRDDRLRGSILIATQVPELAVAEIERLRGHPRMIQILLATNALHVPLGHPIFHPIYRAAADAGLAVAIHALGDGRGIAPSPTGGGFPNLYLEYHTLGLEGMMTHLVSFIAHGVFEKFRDLRLVLLEGGVAWVPPLLWRLDAEYRGLRREVPWLTRLPSEYVREHVRFSTQPLETAPRREQLIDLLASAGGDDLLLFSSDYPHWDSDEPAFVASRLPESWHEKVFYRNALAAYPRLSGTRHAASAGA